MSGPNASGSATDRKSFATKLELREHIAARLIDLEPLTTLNDLVEIMWPLVTVVPYPTTYCIVCGAEPGEPCKVVSDPERGGPGAVRDEPHFYRGSDTKPVVTIAEEEKLPYADTVEPGTEIEVSPGKTLRSDGRMWAVV